jgi:hypothetical protein
MLMSFSTAIAEAGERFWPDERDRATELEMSRITLTT